MYYESISHTTVEVPSAASAALRIRSRQLRSFDALIWRNAAGQRVAAVGDGGLDNPFGEVAVINLDTNRQVESITFAWIEDEATAIRYLEECQESQGNPQGRPVRLPLDGTLEDAPAFFTCGCCGDRFKSTIAKQRIHDQDEGFGHCPECE